MFDLPRFGRGVSLARVDALLDACGVDRARLAERAIVVTGSNGKGSACAFLAATARRLGLGVGVFTSPHLLRVHERFRLDGVDIADDALRALGAEVGARVAALEARFGAGSFGSFEAQFVAAALWFERAGADAWVFEAGIGGRLDATRLARAGVCLLTSVDLEHTALLGSSLELIALDKSDACAPGGTVVHGENLLPLADLLTTSARLRGVTPRFVGRDAEVADVSLDPDAMRFSLRDGRGRVDGLRTTLKGRFQAGNAACAALALDAWLARTGRAVGDGERARALREGVADARWPGRLETVCAAPLVVVDVGHTPDAIARAADALFEAFGAEGWLLVAGVSADKDAAGMLALLKARFARVVCTQAHHKGLDAHEVARALRALPGEAEVTVVPDVAQAAAAALARARAEGLRVFVGGGLFVAVEFAQAVRGEDPRALRFY